MPICKVTSAVKLDSAKETEFLKEVEKVVAESLKKPLGYVAVAYVHAECMRFGGSSDPSACIEVSSIGGISPTSNTLMAQHLSPLCAKHLGVNIARVDTRAVVYFKGVKFSMTEQRKRRNSRICIDPLVPQFST